MKKLFLFSGTQLLAACAALCADADLQTRVEQLEKRLGALEKSIQPLVEKADAEAQTRERVEKHHAEAVRRAQLDSAKYSQEALKEIESLYQVANRQWRSEEGKASLRKLVETYKEANRTGCAVLYLGQMTQGEESEAFLRRAIDQFSDCYYFDGVQVGAYARLVLGQYYQAKGESKKAADLFQEIRDKYGDAVDHNGKPLVASLPSA